MSGLKFAISLVFAVSLAAPAMGATSQPTPGLTKDQFAAIQTLFKKCDPPVLEAFKSEPTLHEAMVADLKIIQTIKDPGAMNAAIKAFQAKYAEAYKKILVASKINLNEVASDLHQILPGLTFRVVDGTSVIGIASTGSGSTPATTPSKTSYVTTLAAADYTFSHFQLCDSGTSVTHSAVNMSSSSTAVELGGCESMGTLEGDFSVASYETAQAEVKVDFDGDAFAVGVLGAAVGETSNDSDLVSSEGSLGDVHLVCTAIAPALWVASTPCTLHNASLSVTLSQGGNYKLILQTTTSAIAAGVVAATNAHSALNIQSATITYSQN